MEREAPDTLGNGQAALAQASFPMLIYKAGEKAHSEGLEFYSTDQFSILHFFVFDTDWALWSGGRGRSETWRA